MHLHYKQLLILNIQKMNTNFLKTGRFFLKSALLLSLSLSVTNCSKDDAPAPAPPAVLAPLQDPLPGYLAASGFNQKVTNFIDEGSYGERGFSFIPTVNGKMTAIVAKMPSINTNPNIRVTIWDKVAGTVLRTEMVTITAANIEIVKTITTLDLVKDKEYFLTFNNNDRYRHDRTDGSATTYPITVGDIKITGFSWLNTTEQLMPTNSVTNYISGDCSFKFQK